MEQTWNESEIKELILFAQSLREENEELRAKLIAMDAMLKNEMAKVKHLTNQLKQVIYAKGNNPFYPN